MQDTEIWIDIENNYGYQVSNLGRVRSIDRIIIDKNGRTRNVTGKVLSFTTLPVGYKQVRLGSKSKKLLVHRLVANAFIPNPTNLPVINHKDENKSNNRVDNLEWCTRSYNELYNNKAQRMIQTKRDKGIPVVPQSAIDGHIRALSKPVVCVETNKEFRSASEASRSMGLSAMAVMNAIRFNRRSGGYHWRYV